MAINKFAVGAVSMIIIDTLYNAIAMILPMWSANKTAGLLGFCIDSELTNANASASIAVATTTTTTSTTTLDHCFYYKFGSSYDALSVLNSEVWTKYSSDGVCKAYNDAGDVSDAEQLAYATVLATAAGMDTEQFDKFLGKSCGLLGTATMTFGGMSMSNGVMAIIAILGAVTCRKGDKKWVGGGFFLASVACFTAMLTFVLWVVQSKPLGEEDDASFKASFFLMIIAMLHYPLAMQQKEAEAFKESEEDHTTYLGAETPVSGTPASLV
ncbi:hypothetical protein PHYSODRAFT_328340 [Phytophthora sojae]|uniref:Uncharacterized protein n=1 Tax=Phytophthora sojae (strain P6497) TaxID=1094619 RepID=G4Z557_PHYSP|nr:hypothetical protein PHYSODRAFT_328340 [Phytophthora sojae]EGZ20200.1 hypothetical protein PHYSODRAFT_328340 [Phytophthora sojae]|eukprot:XP_009522917.1 hypothetical protein PHYSODRAFT_328340 [Phytophthora sojae]